MNDKPPPQQEDAVPRKMSLLGQKTASERAARTLRKNWTMPGATPALPLEPSVEPQAVVVPDTPPDTPPNTQDEPNGRAVEATDTSSAADIKKKKDKKKKSKKKKNKDKKSKGKKAAK